MPSAFSRDIENLIAQFRGLPRNLSRSTLRESRPIDSLIQSCLKSYKIGETRPEEQIMANWKDIVGQKNAHRSRPKTISRGSLVIVVANPTIRNELQFDREQIIKRLCNLSGCANISDITFIAG